MSPARKRRILPDGSPKNSDEKQNIEDIKADLENKIRAERIHNEHYIEVMRANRKTIESKGLFQRRAGLSKFY